MKIKGFVGEFANYAICKNCGTDLRNDNGFMFADDSAVCRDTSKCSLRQSRNRINEQKDAGTFAPRWRKTA